MNNTNTDEIELSLRENLRLFNNGYSRKEARKEEVLTGNGPVIKELKTVLAQKTKALLLVLLTLPLLSNSYFSLESLVMGAMFIMLAVLIDGFKYMTPSRDAGWNALVGGWATFFSLSLFAQFQDILTSQAMDALIVYGTLAYVTAAFIKSAVLNKKTDRLEKRMPFLYFMRPVVIVTESRLKTILSDILLLVVTGVVLLATGNLIF